MEFELTFEEKEPTILEPRFLIVYSSPKAGKTSLLMQLPNSYHIDLETSGGFYKGNSIDVTKTSKEVGKHPIAIIKEISTKIKEANDKKGSPVFDFITLDSATVLEDYATLLATKNYKNSVIGKSYTGGNVVTDLPSGGGYSHLRTAFEELYLPFVELAGKCFILVVHTKESTVTRDGKDLTVTELNLAGKLKMITASKADGIGLLYRSKKEKGVNMISFKTNDINCYDGCRTTYLRDREFEISRLEGDVLKNNWETIFPSLKKLS